jgi:hypothetical protein
MPLVYDLHDGRRINVHPRGASGYAVEVVTPDGAVEWSDTPLDLLKAAHQKRIQLGARVSADEVRALAAEVRKAQESKPEDGTPVRRKVEPGIVYIRAMKAPSSSAEKVVDATGALAAAWKVFTREASDIPEGALVYWDKDADLRAVDVDWHASSPPRRDEVERLAISCRPAPSAYWITHGGGLRLIYSSLGEFEAEELAACAAAYVLSQRPEATIEIKCDSRHPASLRDGKRAGEPREAAADTTLAILGRFSRRGCTDAERDGWLENQGMTLYGTFAHHFCPIDAHHVSKNASPVWAGDSGIFCASCQARTGDGFRSYGRLVGTQAGDEDSPVYQAARECVHWDQASFYFEALTPDIPEPLWRPIYAALAKSLHQNDPSPERARLVFAPFPFVRGVGTWLNADTFAPVRPMLGKEDVARLAYCKTWAKDEDGQTVLKSDGTRVIQAATNATLPGMAALEMLHGSPIYGVHNQPVRQTTDGIRVVPPSKKKNQRCRYIPRRDRMPLAEAWTTVDRYFPGLNHDYLTLLHLARGYAEIGDGMLPILFAQGPSGSAKTTTGLIETCTSGDLYKDIGMGDWNRIAEALGEAAQEAGGIALNEFAKVNTKLGGAAATWILQLGRALTFRKNYVGNITIPLRSYLLLTDTEMPYTLFSNEQFGRRVVYIRLRQTVSGWGSEGITAQNWMQQEGSQRAADTIHSWIVDEHFPEGISKSFQDAARGIGYGTIDAQFHASEEGKERASLAAELFKAVCAEVPHTGHKETGRGWVFCGLESEAHPVGGVLRSLISLMGEESTEMRAVESALAPLYGRWKKLLDLREAARVEVKKVQRKLYIRFRSDDDMPQYAVNSELAR